MKLFPNSHNSTTSQPELPSEPRQNDAASS
jgi:hypothetical protein